MEKYKFTKKCFSKIKPSCYVNVFFCYIWGSKNWTTTVFEWPNVSNGSDFGWFKFNTSLNTT